MLPKAQWAALCRIPAPDKPGQIWPGRETPGLRMLLRKGFATATPAKGPGVYLWRRTEAGQAPFQGGAEALNKSIL